jgi:hypothetical protein
LKKQLKKVKMNSGSGAREGTQLKEVGIRRGNYFTQVPIDANKR